MSGIPPGPPPGPPPINNVVNRPPGPPPGGPPAQSFRPPPFGFPSGPSMGIPPMMPNFPPPLPAGWSEHRAPDGVTPYFYNSQTRESTYIRPTLFPPFPPQAITPNNGSASPVPSAEKEKKKKKEKPKEKVPIPGTTWTRVTTTEGNVFYFEKESKKSEWSIPEEIKEAVEALEAEEKAIKEGKEREEKQKAEEERLEQLREIERIRLEMQEEKKKKQVELERKRKEREDQVEEREAKVSKTEVEDTDGRGQADENGDDDDEENGAMGPQDEEDEAEWMRAVAAEFAEADQQLEAEKQKTAEEIKREEEEAAKKVFAVPEKVQVSPEEGRALFKALLIEKDVNPFSTWEAALPTFINDPRYVLLSSQKERQEVYDEYCRDVGRARRLAKSSTASGSGSADRKKSDPEREYKALLREEVTSTRTRWDDFRKKWKKERKFYAYGRDDRDREKMFKTHLRELGERKRADAQRAEQDFYELLKESDAITSSSIWSDVKKTIYKDSRYEAVGSSSLREELFNNHIKNLASSSTSNGDKEVLSKEEEAARKLAERKAKAEASLKEREAKIRQEKSKIEFENNKSRIGAGKEEAERLFGSLLVDQVRDHNITWSDASQFLSSDSRFNNPSLHPRDKQRIFSQHIERISSKRSNELHQLFESNTPSLDTKYDDVYPKIVEDPIIKRLGLQGDNLENQWKIWLRNKESIARREFDEMLGENSFIEFWGKMRKKNLDENALNVKIDDQFAEAEGLRDIVGEDDDNEKKNINDMAKQINLSEIKSVLRRDKRYRQFDHIPEKRESWLRDYLENLEAASGSKTIHNIGYGQ
ncbi:uncharacterized protein I206_104254 [Kwoniella pini CBS 10737]|uniref:Transcription elongation regulator 1 n=1 Tax=Kwoniella pini CBS 10737 TaxID=1296096 RepID=A0A1B9I2F6_9TREE|nr:transcription elongation regulator 1 [Kwoniella pini CBS 10737]OCF49648.1 transcription elongation regulator 1 [Kwoniella pini CBS 10737]